MNLRFVEKLSQPIPPVTKYIIPPISGEIYIDFSIEKIPFNIGVYSVSVKLINGSLINTIDYHIGSKHFQIEAGGKIGHEGKVWLNGKWGASNE